LSKCAAYEHHFWQKLLGANFEDLADIMFGKNFQKTMFGQKFSKDPATASLNASL